MPKKTAVLVAFIPVLHAGYMKFFQAHPEINSLYLIDGDLLKEEDYIRKDLRVIEATQMAHIISSAGYFRDVRILNDATLAELDVSQTKVIFADEDISRHVAKKILNATTEFYPVFLRWDRKNIEQIDAEDEDVVITDKALQRNIMRKALEAAGQSSDIWRRVGAVLISKDKSIKQIAYNRGEPHAYSPWMVGDPRNIFKRGVGIEMSTFSHAEAVLIAEAARQGVKLEGAVIYVTTYPCPACAKLIAHSGIKTCYYKDGYAVLDGKQIFTAYGVKIVKVNMNDQVPGNGPEWVEYRKD